jgi:hypothetical protein
MSWPQACLDIPMEVPLGMCRINADVINRGMLEFIQG